MPTTLIKVFSTLAHFIISPLATAERKATAISKTGVFICQTTTARTAKRHAAVISLCFIDIFPLFILLRQTMFAPMVNDLISAKASYAIQFIRRIDDFFFQNHEALGEGHQF